MPRRKFYLPSNDPVHQITLWTVLDHDGHVLSVFAWSNVFNVPFPDVVDALKRGLTLPHAASEAAKKGTI
jgi:hypothetical protein